MKTWYSQDPAEYRTNKNSLFESAVHDLNCSFTEDESLNDFFNGLGLLDSVPMTGIIADENMLPPESLRVFFINQNWVNSLIDGAMSIGRNCSEDIIHDNAVLDAVISKSYILSSERRRAKYGMDRKSEDINSGNNIRTGFLLNSKLLRGWPGLEISCFDKTTKLDILKLTLIGDSILFCIADGQLNKIVFTEPAESLYFGFDEENGIPVKNLVSQKEGEMGTSIGISEPLIFRNDGKKLLDVKQFADKIYSDLKSKDKAGPFFSSLEFAMQMLYERNQCVIEIDASNKL